MQNQHRQLAAILFTDIVGYTALMQENEQKAVALIKHYNAALNKTVGLHNGKVLNYYGDGSLCSFPSVTEALNCAIELQKELQSEPNVPLRIGLHVGEVFFENKKALGDGVNVASRIQSLGQANTILFSKEIFDKIRNQPEFKSVSLGLFEFKNVNESMEVFALSNEGLNIPKKEKMSGKLKDSGRKSSAKKIMLATGIVALLIIALLASQKFFGKKELAGKDKTIAVLPFKNISVDKEVNEPFCVGVALELQKNLEWMSGLIPIASQSVEKFRDTKMSIADIARELGGIKYIVQGTVQRDKNKIKVFASLIDAVSGKQIWGDEYPGEVEDVFSLQENIAKQIATALQVNITPDEKSRIGRVATKNTKALDAYNEALSDYVKLVYAFHSTLGISLLLNEQLYPDYLKTLSLCNNVLERDSNMAEAYALKAKILFYKYSNRGSDNFPGLLDSIASLGHKALSLDDNSVDTYVILANCFNEKGQKNSGLQLLEKGLAISPNNFEVNWEMGKYYIISDPEKSIRFLKKSLRLDPLSVWTPMVYNDLSFAYINICDFEKAEFYCRKTLALSTNSIATAITLWNLEVLYSRMGKADSVLKYADQALKLNDKNALYFKAEAYCYLKNDCAKAVQLYEEHWNKMHVYNNQHRWAIALWKTGKNSRLAEQLFDSSFASYKRDHPLSYDLAGMYAFKGDKENAIRILKQIDWSFGLPYLIQTDPLFDKIRNDKEFKDLVQKAIDEKTKLRERISKLEEEGKL
jgi:adenylate cyclase